MKKIILTSFIVLILASFCWAYESSIKSLLGVPFGEVCKIKAVFVDKPDTYYAQNISHSEFYLKIIEVNNKLLSKPLIVEAIYENMKIDKSKIYTLKAYEIVQSQNEPKGWSNKDIFQQFDYWIIQKIVIKNP